MCRQTSTFELRASDYWHLWTLANQMPKVIYLNSRNLTRQKQRIKDMTINNGLMLNRGICCYFLCSGVILCSLLPKSVLTCVPNRINRGGLFMLILSI